MIIYLVLLSPIESSDLPEFRTGNPIHYGLAPDGVYMALYVTIKTVVSYTAFSTLPKTWWYISVALSLESPPPDVIWHPAL
jgi:hypothetical protein